MTAAWLTTEQVCALYGSSSMPGLDLFAGCGGASLGCEAAGVRIVAAYERDARAARTHQALLPDVPVHVEDLNEIDPDALPNVPFWWASPPCQPGSTAGLRGGMLDPRDGYPALLRLARAKRPTWLVIENVPGFMQHRSASGCGALWPKPEACPACYLAVIIRELDELFPVVEVRTLDAADYGVPQRRERLITVCGPERIDWPEPTHGPGRPVPWAAAGTCIDWQSVPGFEHLEGAYAIEHGGTRGDKGYLYRPTGEPGPTVGTASDMRLVIETGQNKGGIPGNPCRHPAEEPGSGRGPTVTDPADPAPAVTTHANCYIVAAGESGEGRPRDLAEPSPTVSGKGTAQLVDQTYTRIRTLTVRERAALQALPWAPELTGRTVGNAVPPPLAEAVVRRAVSAALMRCA